ncbi:MAG TPA: hypothetical protein VK181_23240 [Rhizobium sp.]|nr:hypothetical protein [Rhizobium sp.]
MVDRSSLTKEWTLDAVILAPGAALELIQFYRRRVDELLETANRYLERARAAEQASNPRTASDDKPTITLTEVAAHGAIERLTRMITARIVDDLYKSPATVVRRPLAPSVRTPTGDIGSKNLLRPIVGIENHTAQEVFDIMRDRIAAAPAPTVRVNDAEDARTMLHLILVFCDDMNDRNWADKRLYIKQQAERILSALEVGHDR